MILLFFLMKRAWYKNGGVVKVGNVQLTVGQALHKLNKKGLPYQYDLNIYRSCSHGCKYCYALKSQQYLSELGTEDDIFVKTNILEALERELAAPGWQKEIINIGGVCDSYQAAEATYQLMPEVLRLMVKYKNPVIISTKSSLILRDLELIDELASYTYVNIPVCITAVNPQISAKVEPGAALPEERFRTICEIGKTRAYTGFHVMPILPFLADDAETLDTLAWWAHEAKASYMLTGVLYLTGGIRKRYLSFIADEFPEYYEAYVQLYPKGSASPEYKNQVHTLFNQMKEQYQINTSYAKFLPKKPQTKSAGKRRSTSKKAQNESQEISLFEVE